MVNNAVEIICDGNKKIGLGHLRRSLTLFNQLKKDNIPVSISGISKESNLLLPENSSGNVKSKIKIIDLPINSGFSLSKNAFNESVIITLDHFGSFVPDYNIVVFAHKRPYAKKKVFTGLKYILLREEIRLLPGSPEKIQDLSNVLVILGGSDLLNEGHKVAKKLTNMSFEVTLIQGPFARNKELSQDYEVLVNPPNLPDLIKNSGWVVTNGGGSLFETMYVGKAAVALPQSKEETSIAKYMLTQSAILGVGFDQIQQFEPSKIKSIQHNAHSIIDGKGHARIVNIIKDIL